MRYWALSLHSRRQRCAPICRPATRAHSGAALMHSMFACLKVFLVATSTSPAAVADATSSSRVGMAAPGASCRAGVQHVDRKVAQCIQNERMCSHWTWVGLHPSSHPDRCNRTCQLDEQPSSHQQGVQDGGCIALDAGQILSAGHVAPPQLCHMVRGQGHGPGSAPSRRGWRPCLLRPLRRRAAAACTGRPRQHLSLAVLLHFALLHFHARCCRSRQRRHLSCAKQCSHRRSRCVSLVRRQVPAAGACAAGWEAVNDLQVLQQLSAAPAAERR